MMSKQAPVCELCGEPMPAGETMFRFHGYSGRCPKPPKSRKARDRVKDRDLVAYANGGWESLGEDTIASIAAELLEHRAARRVDADSGDGG
jgi:hypothetical protein